MTDMVNLQETPEQRVFGEAFTFETGAADRTVQQAYFNKRVADASLGRAVWIVPTFEADTGVAAHYYIGGLILATIDFEYETQSASVSVTSKEGEFGERTLCDGVPFNEAVFQAELHAANNLPPHLDLT